MKNKETTEVNNGNGNGQQNSKHQRDITSSVTTLSLVSDDDDTSQSDCSSMAATKVRFE